MGQRIIDALYVLVSVVLVLVVVGCGREEVGPKAADRVIIPRRERKPPASVVVLSSREGAINRARLMEAVRRAWPTEDGQLRRITAMPLPMAGVGAGGEQDDEPAGPSLLVLLQANPPLNLPAHSSILALAGRGSYGKTPAQLGEQERQLWESQKSWVAFELLEGSVDLSDEQASELRERFYQLACRAAAELLDDSSLLVVLPREQLVHIVGETTKASLSSADPLSAFQSGTR